ncbi:hypothetical protein MSG28_006294 [Choristoneura fumiferana]|uniref:Uncharacterized protein n=1 Tax=Choristoneura fumiferana TaxID=7141 RepID=A0ACC0JEF8_CHOFU|nr:hypothetical protein MSG28_006294 [Choristoneura fumiferana]
MSVGGAVTCLRIRDLRIPSHVAEGSEAVLSCKYELGKQHLYAVKWFKDDREFYRYQPVTNGTQAFTEKGVSVDVS